MIKKNSKTDADQADKNQKNKMVTQIKLKKDIGTSSKNQSLFPDM